MNTLKIAVLMAGLTGLLVAIGGAFGGRSGMILCFVLAMGMNFFSYWFSDKIVLKMYKGREVTAADRSELYEVTHELAQKANMPMPRVYEIPSDGLNAFATGRNRQHAAVAATHGIMRVLTREELRGVMAHELSHINNRDVLIGTIAAAFVGAITMIAHMGQFAMMFGGFGGRHSDDEDRGGGLGAILMLILAPIGAMVIQMAISRSREYQADASGAKLSGDPRALASALRKLEIGAQRMPMAASPATAHMFIVNPLRGGGISNLFSTHPAMEERIKRLEAMQA
jgi:heat shock protein HtpX